MLSKMSTPKMKFSVIRLSGSYSRAAQLRLPEPAPAGRGLRCKLGHGLGSKISAPEYGTGSSSRGLAHHISFLRFCGGER